MKYLVMPLLVVAVLVALLVTGCQDVKSPIEDRDWVLASYQEPNGTMHDALPGVPVTARFDSEKGHVSGSGGCNSYGGEYTVDKLTLTIGNMAWTERACLEPERKAQETNFLTALQKAEEFRVGHNTLTISGSGWELNFNEATPAP